jgi:hypothetical protein
MNRWLVSTACTLSLAVPALARAQNPSDTTIKADTTITQTQTTTQSETDTLYRSGDSTRVRDFGPTTSTGMGGSTDTTVRTTPAPTYGGSSSTPSTTDTARVTGPTYGTTYAEQEQQDEDDNDQKAGFEIKGGLSWGNVSNRGVLPGSLDGRNGVALGLGMFGGSPVGFGIEGLYVQRGVENDVFDVNSRRLDYIDVPGYLRISVPFALQPFIYAGPQVSFEVRCRAGSTVGAVDCPDTGRPTTSWSGIIGAGFRLNPGVALSIEGRYVYGLTDLNLSTVTSSSSYRTRSFMLLAGIGL